MKLADYISGHMEEILQQWQDYARTFKAAGQMNQEALRDHARQMLESIAKDMNTSQSEDEALFYIHLILIKKFKNKLL